MTGVQTCALPISVRVNPGSVLGGTDSNVQFGALSSGQTIIYDATAGYWKNSTLTAGSGISITNGAGSITINATNAGTVTSVTATAPLASTGGATPDISISQATTSTNGYLSSTDWNTFNNKTTLPTLVSGQYLTNNGTTTSWSALPSALVILLHNGSSTSSVSVANGVLPILNHSGSTINVAVS